MNQAGTRFVYITGTLVGIPALAVALRLVSGESVLMRAAQLGAVFALLGLLAGLVWAAGRWHWGTALAIPFLALLALSVGFAGQLGPFVVHDLPLVIGVIAGGGGGGEIGAWVRRRGWRAA